ncbi:uncharacterized protein ColSpa_11708 [Colletotrichum spaethianum]|uniref:Uncharacterized protein n=1 Tax=Colletotrichum spaethianum TaxID=700344 RepID=A0AA37URW4_9PEZI|nr:uncharacterized protein ColSpa_11708 [Colletotrichum spaethianum]GKT51527.1 hypothetical protein ColSpa_11708 [Colletotrichum spaethianum]
MSLEEFTFDEQHAVPAFYADLEVLDDPAVPYEDKKWMFDVILMPYRYHDGPRMFPDINFYITLLYNRPNNSEIWGLVCRFHEWISMMAALHPDEADQAIEALELRAVSHGWPGPQVTLSETSPIEQGWNAPEQMVTPEPSVNSNPSFVSKRKRAKSSNSYQTEHQHPLLKTELVAAPTFRYKGLVQNMDHFTKLYDAYERHIKRDAGAAPNVDASWPSSAEQQRASVERLVGHVTDLSNFYELRKARERLAKLEAGRRGQDQFEAAERPSRKRSRDAEGEGADFDQPIRPKGISKTDWALMDAESTPVELLDAVIHYRISDIEIELLCWRLLLCSKRAAMETQLGFTLRPLWSGTKTVSTWEHFDTFAERWQAICENVLDCKIIVHSLTRADWVCKYAGAPTKERGAKLSNDLLNGRRDIQNQVGRDVIKEKTSRQDWTTSEDFEIRNKEGELVLKGGHLGDKRRRQLAFRSQQSSES